MIGLELRPRKIREASSMWQQLTDAVGLEKRDAIWSHPDLIPTEQDIKDPAKLIERTLKQNPEDEIDAALRDLLG